MERQLWIDIGPLFRHVGNVAGIERVAISLAQEWLVDADLPLRFCGYDVVQGHFREVERGPVERRFATVATAQGSIASSKPPKPAKATKPPKAPKPPPAEHRSGARTSLGRAYQAVKSLSRPIVRPRSVPVAELPPQAPEPPREVDAALAEFASVAAPFAPGDTLFLPLNSWGWRGILPVLAGLHANGGLRLVPMIYDVIPLSQPHLVNLKKRDVYASWFEGVFGQSAAVVTISENSCREILDQAGRRGLSGPRVEVVRLGDHIQHSGPPSRPLELPAHVEQGFVLCVGTICERKNQQLLYRAWRELLARHGDRVPPLVLVGRANQPMGEALLVQMRHDPFVEGRVIILNNASDPETQWLLERCLFTMFPSQYEGWGLPVAEGLAYGKYCVCSSASSLPEIAGDLIDYHDPLDLPACLELVERALFMPGFLGGREDRIGRQFPVTSWRSCAEHVLRIVRDPTLATAGDVGPVSSEPTTGSGRTEDRTPHAQG